MTSQETPVFLSSMAATERGRRLALAVVAMSFALFVALAPFAKVQLAPVIAFIPMYQSAMVVNDVITATLLFGQFSILRSRAVLALAAAYLFTAFLAAFHALSFPGLFAPTGLLGAGPQSTAWLYMFWHAGFPLLVIAYAWLKPVDARRELLTGRTWTLVLLTIAATFAAACVLTAIATAGHAALPSIMAGNRYTPLMVAVVSTVWLLSFVALVVMYRQKPHSLLDLWLMVSLCAWIFDIALSAVLNQGRYDVGFYAGRAYGLAAATFVLLVLLTENVVLHHRLAKALEAERAERELVQRRTEELAAANKELEAFAYSVSHDLRAPLRAVDGYAKMLEEDYGARLDDEGRRKLAVLCASSRNMGQLIDDLLALSRLGRQPLATNTVDLDALLEQVIDESRGDLDGREVQFVADKLGEVHGDAVLLKQVYANLVGNAIKFTRGRKPAVVEAGTRTEPDGTKVYFVKDNGAGFDMRYATKLFGVFQRLHRMDEYEGTGVGLAIVRRLVERHGGRTWADSSPGAGATFFFTLGK